MEPAPYGPRFDSNPLADDSPEAWDRLVGVLPLVLVAHGVDRWTRHADGSVGGPARVALARFDP